MGTREPVSVLLPTVEWGSACEQLAAGLESGDELLVCCDSEADPVAGHDPPEGVEVVVGGEPTGCSGKANALAAGTERAENDRFVWTDDDFERGPDWLDRLVAAANEAGTPATAVPVFVGGGWWRPFEPWYGALFALLMTHRVGALADTAWGGGVTFTREELTVSVGTLADELRTVLSDDYLLTQRLGRVQPVRSLVTAVEVDPGARAVYHRLVRFTRIVGVNEGFGSMVATSVVLVAVAALWPLLAGLVLALLFVGVYRHLGVEGGGAPVALAGLVCLPVVTLATRFLAEFEWAGRRYRLADDGTVTVLED